MTFDEIDSQYKKLTKFKDKFQAEEFPATLKGIALGSLTFLKDVGRIECNTKIPNKSYFAFSAEGKRGLKMSRAVRTELFTDDPKLINLFFDCLEKNDFKKINPPEIAKACYTIAISLFVVMDLNKKDDRGTPATFFERFVAYVYTKRLGITPTKGIKVLNLDMDDSPPLPTDYIFDLGKQKPKFHLPIKTSTRERMIQAFAHQRVLDGVYGVGRFWGTLVCFAETKLDSDTLEVVEICVPAQLQSYQMFIAQLKRIYYFDPPQKYMALNSIYPKIHISNFSNFLVESNDLTSFDA